MNTRDRLANLVDGIIAIIATISILSLPVPKNSSLSELIAFGVNFWLFIVNFLIILSLWNNQRFLLDHLKIINSRLVWITIYWLMFLCGLPIILKWMMSGNHSLISVLAFGIDNILIKLIFAVNVIQGIKVNYKGDNDLKFLTRHYLIQVGFSIFYSLIPLLIAPFQTYLSIGLFIFLPLLGSVRGFWQTSGKALERVNVKHSQKNKNNANENA